MKLFAGSNDRLKRISYQGKEIMLADYRGLKEPEMIELTHQHRDLILREGKESLFVANYDNTWGTPGYMNAAHDFTKTTKHLVTRGAFLGINGPKVALLKGVVYFLKVDFRAFDNEQDALEFLVS